jgi:hypothetical protein
MTSGTWLNACGKSFCLAVDLVRRRFESERLPPSE